MDSEKRVRDYLKESNRLFKKNGELWVRCKYRDALIWYRYSDFSHTPLDAR